MLDLRLARTLPWLVLLVFALPFAGVVSADSHLDEPDEAYDYWIGTYDDWDRADVEAAGYQIDTECVSAAALGLPDSVGAMGYHAVNMDYATSGELKVEEPHVILLDADGKVIGVEYEYPEVVDPAPEVGGVALEITPPHPGMEHEHMSIHIYFVGDEDERFGTWNTAVSCPAEDMASMDHADDDAVDEGEAKVVSEAQPHGMPTTGLADLPGGRSGMLLLAIALLLGVAAVGMVLS